MNVDLGFLSKENVCFLVWYLLYAKEHGFVKIEDINSLALRLVGVFTRRWHLSPSSLPHYIPINVTLAGLSSPVKGFAMRMWD